MFLGWVVLYFVWGLLCKLQLKKPKNLNFSKNHVFPALPYSNQKSYFLLPFWFHLVESTCYCLLPNGRVDYGAFWIFCAQFDAGRTLATNNDRPTSVRNLELNDDWSRFMIAEHFKPIVQLHCCIGCFRWMRSALWCTGVCSWADPGTTSCAIFSEMSKKLRHRQQQRHPAHLYPCLDYPWLL